MNKHVFILGYNACEYFDEWFDVNNYSKDYKFYFIDNGNQNISSKIKNNMEVYKTSKNIGCGGGWNLICDIGFKYKKLDKLIIGEEDALFSNEILDELWNVSDFKTLSTTYNNGFGYALFCMHQNVFQEVGRFDENILFAGCEDNDYDHRCKIAGVTNKNLNISSQYNQSSTTNDPNSPRGLVGNHNASYVDKKWGNYNYTEPFNGNNSYKFHKLLIEFYGELEEFPSESEYKLYLNSNK